MSYFPVAENRSGQILASGMMGAADAQAKMMQGISENIGQALLTIGSAYKDYSDMKSSIKSGEKMLDVLGPAIGMTTEKLKALGYNDMKDREKAMFFNGLFGGGLYASAAQAINFGNKLQQTGQMPYINAGIKNQQNIAGGNVPHGGMGVPQSPSGIAPVEPDLPVGDENLPAVGGPTAAPAVSIPGGQSSIDAINRDRQRRGLPPIK